MKRAVLSILAGIAVFATATVVFADANNKENNGYDAQSRGTAGLTLPGVGPVAWFSDSQSRTGGSGSNGSSSAGLFVLGIGVGRPASCNATGQPTSGVVSSSDSQSLATIPDNPAGVSGSLLTSSCEHTRRVQSNDSSGRSEFSALSLSGPGFSATFLDTRSDSLATSGNAKGTSRLTAASVTAGPASATLVECSSRTFANNGTTKGTTSGTLVNGTGDISPLCALLTSSSATYSK